MESQLRTVDKERAGQVGIPLSTSHSRAFTHSISSKQLVIGGRELLGYLGTLRITVPSMVHHTQARAPERASCSGFCIAAPTPGHQRVPRTNTWPARRNWVPPGSAASELPRLNALNNGAPRFPTPNFDGQLRLRLSGVGRLTFCPRSAIYKFPTSFVVRLFFSSAARQGDSARAVSGFHRCIRDTRPKTTGWKPE